MNELKSPITLLVLILVVAAFVAPYGTPELITFVRDFLPAVATLVAAYVGAIYGAKLVQESANKDKRLHQIASGSRALFTIWRQLNSIAQYQEDVTSKFRNYDAAPLAMPPINLSIESTVRLDIDSLAFLLDHNQSELLANLSIAQARFIDAVETIKSRSSLHSNEVQPRLENKIPEGRNLTPDELCKIIGIRLFTNLVNQTHGAISKTDDAVHTLEVLEGDLHTALKSIFPEAKFPLSQPINQASSRPTGLL